MNSSQQLFADALKRQLTYWDTKTSTLNEQAIAHLTTKVDTLYKTIPFGLQRQELFEQTARIVAQSFRIIEFGGAFREWLPLIKQIFVTPLPLSPKIMSELYDQYGYILRMMGRFDEAHKAHETALTLGTSTNDNEAIGRTYYHLGALYERIYKIDEARNMVVKAIDILEKHTTNSRWLAASYNALGIVSIRLGELQRAEEAYEQAIAIARRRNDDTMAARYLKNLAAIYHRTEHYDKALEKCHESLHLLNGTNSKRDIWRAQNQIGVTKFLAKAYDEAFDIFDTLDSVEWHSILTARDRAMVVENKSHTLFKLGKYATAETYGRIATERWQALNDPFRVGYTQSAYAGSLYEQGYKEDAIVAFSFGMSELRKCPPSPIVNQLLKDYEKAIAEISASKETNKA